MARQREDKSIYVWWKIVAPLTIFVVEAGSREQAKTKALKHVKLEHKPWLANDWIITIASHEDRELYAAHADALVKPEPTERTVKKDRKTVHNRLFGT